MTAGSQRAKVQKWKSGARDSTSVGASGRVDVSAGWGALSPSLALALALQLPFPVTADPSVLDLQPGHAAFHAAVAAADPERLMPVLGLQRASRHAPAMASAQPAERSEQEHGFGRASLSRREQRVG